MAKEKNQAVEETGLIELSDAELSALLPEGMSLKDFKDTGLLTPTYALEAALKEKWPPFGGFLNKLVVLPLQGKGADARHPIMVEVFDLTQPTKGQMGSVIKKTNETVGVAKGGALNVPVGGRLSVDQDLIHAIHDIEHVYPIMGWMSGKLDINNGQPNEMNVIRLKLGKPRKRVEMGHKYVLTPQYIQALAGGHIYSLVKSKGKSLPSASMLIDPTAPIVDPSTGEVIEGGKNGQQQRMSA